MAKDPISPMTVDKRVVERNIKKGLLTRDEYDKHLAALPDVAEHAETVQARLGAEEPEDDEDDLDENDEDDETDEEENGAAAG